jgi:exo-poly-alpha-galacturonosidase
MFRLLIKKKPLCTILVLAITSFFLSASIFIKPKRYDVTNYGAIGNGETVNTQAIQKAIDECAANGGGEVVVPKGVFVSGAIFLKKGVALFFEKDAVLKGSVNRADYPQIKTRWEGTDMMYMAALVNADGINGVKISGEGTIDGSGDVWVQRVNNRQDTAATAARRWERPRLMGIQNCKGVKVSGLKLHNQAVWCVHILYCEDVVLEDLNITADHNIPSSDGIDIDSSKKVKIRKCFIDVNDDCISIKSGKDEDGLRVNRPSEDILVQDCHFAYGHGGVAMGSETSGGIRNVLIKDCIADASNWAPIRFKSQPSRGGVVENIIYENFKLKDTRKAVEFNMAWRMVPPIKPPAKVLPVVRNVQLINISGNVNAVGDIHGLEGSPILGVTFKNCNITAQKGLLIEHARNVDLSGLKLDVKEGEAVTKKDVE